MRTSAPDVPCVAVTGATGFIGRHLVQHLLDTGWRVRVLLRGDPMRMARNGDAALQIVAGDLGQPDALQRLVDGVDAVIHLAGAIKATSRQQFFEVNVRGSERLAQAAGRSAPGAHFLHVSSLAAREPELSDYAASKRAGEDASRKAFGAPITTLRPPAVYGPGDRETLAFFQLARQKLVPLLGPPEARAAMIHVADLSRLIAQLAGEAPRDRVLTACDARADGYRWKEVMEAAARAVGNPSPRFVQAPVALLRSVALVGDACRVLGTANMLNSQKLRELRHPDWSVSASERATSGQWQAEFDLDAGFADAVAGYRAAGWLPPAH